ncbi:MAG: LuxR C-terminal-related transcriptional regulator [Acidimicrobiales bacterium]
MSSHDALVEEGRAAFRSGDGAAARRAFEAALAERESGAAYEGLGQAHYVLGEYQPAISAYERAYATYRTEAEALGAGNVARMLAWVHGGVYGDWVVQNAWMGRARSLLAEAGGESVEHGWVEMIDALSESDRDRCIERLPTAVAIGRRFGDADLEFDALANLGLMLVVVNRVEEGMLLVDEALAAICAGEVEDLPVIEGCFCGMFLACERTQDVVRAEQWLRAAEDLANRRRLRTVSAFCRTHYGGILTAAGRWEEAEASLTETARLTDRGSAAMRQNALVRLADLRVRQGRLEEAGQLLEGLDQHPYAVRPVAALQLATGNIAQARETLERALRSEAVEIPVGSLLALLVDVHLAAGELEEAAGATSQLEVLAEEVPSDYHRAVAALARGKVCLASSSGDAQLCLEGALTAFSRAHMPVERARARLELAKALAEERPELAIAEATTALDDLERLEAARDADAAAALVRSLGGPARTGPKGVGSLTQREAEVLDLLGHGLSNPEIGERLFISRKTVEHHVGRLLAKLGLRSRAEAAAYATRQAAEGIRD